jgi:hypothetical protein
MSTWNGWGDTATRLFVPFGIGADRENSPWWDLGGQLTSGGQAQEDERKRKELLYQQSAAAGGFADQNQQSYGQLGQQGQGALAGLQALANGQNSVSAEQLRQALGRNQAQQMSIAAGAAPQDAAGAGRTAAIQSGRLGAGLAGQQAIAGLQERNQAQQQYAQLLQGLRGQDLNAALGSRQTATTGYGANNAGTPEKTEGQKVGPVIQSVFSAMSDRRLKKNIKDGDAASSAALKGLRSYVYEYKDGKHGKGARPGIMAQDLERAGLGHAVIDTPEGKAVHGAHLATANTAMLAALGRRVAKIESDK